jgi:CheY-like chemotaxis protein
MNGVELVRAMRRDPRFRQLPVIVQTRTRLMARSDVWTELNVEQSLEKDQFRRWLRETVSAGHAVSGRPPGLTSRGLRRAGPTASR